MITTSMFLLSLTIEFSMTHSVPASNKVDTHFKDNLIAIRKLRFKRQTCQDDTYQHGGITCCLCAAGQHLKRHCTDSGKPWNRTCVMCEPGETYNSHPNNLDSCEPCTSCDPKANLQVKDQCTVSEDTSCQCQQGHFCDKGPENCKVCYPCRTCGNEGINIACTATNNTICKDAQTKTLPVLLGVLGVLCAVAAVAVGIVCVKKRKKLCWVPDPVKGSGAVGPKPKPAYDPVEMMPLQSVNLSAHLPDIARILGWRITKEVAIRSNLRDTAIESHLQNNPNDIQEATYQLLKELMEKQGTTAYTTLITTLHSMDKKSQANEIKEMVKKQ